MYFPAGQENWLQPHFPELCANNDAVWPKQTGGDGTQHGAALWLENLEAACTAGWDQDDNQVSYGELKSLYIFNCLIL